MYLCLRLCMCLCVGGHSSTPFAVLVRRLAPTAHWRPRLAATPVATVKAGAVPERLG